MMGLVHKGFSYLTFFLGFIVGCGVSSTQYFFIDLVIMCTKLFADCNSLLALGNATDACTWALDVHLCHLG